ncbi:MAG: hypothetical protein M3Z85_21930 [Acidobacteriota bacterium]|nr:hypothetical protein [Acidobacteriota bacterium]
MKRFLAICCLTTGVFAAEKVETPIDNDQVKVLKVQVQPHEKTRLHQHKVNRVMIYLDAGTQDFDYEGKKSTLNFKAGDVKWSPAAGMHIAEITSAQPVSIVEVELKKAGSGTTHKDALDPVKIDPKHYRVEFDNPQVRVLRVNIGPHETAPMHVHSLNRVVTYLHDQKVRVTTPDGKTSDVEHKAGDVAWAGQAKHKEENVADQPMEVVVVELKD